MRIADIVGQLKEIVEETADYKTSERMTLSVACITSMEPSLDDMIESVSGVVDEIVVVNSNQYRVIPPDMPGVKYYFRKWDNDFAAARNYAFSKCTSDWILWLDSDDILPEESGKMIRAAFDNPGILTKGQSCFFNLVVTSKNEIDSGAGVLQPRITPNLPDIKWKGRIHENHVESLEGLRLQPVTVDNIFVLHTGYDDHDHMAGKVLERNIPMLEKEEDSPHKFYHLGQSYMALEDYINAEMMYDAAIRDYPLTRDFSDQVHFCRGIARFKRGLYKEAESDFSYCSGRINESDYWMGLININIKRYKTAESFLEKYLETEQKNSFWSVNPVATRRDAYEKIIWLKTIPAHEWMKRRKAEFPVREIK